MTINMLSNSNRGAAETEMIHRLPEYRGAMSVYAAGREMMSMKYDGEKFNRVSPWGGGDEPLVGDEAFKGNDVLFPKITKQNTASGQSQGAMVISSEISGIKFNKGVKDKVFQVD